MEQDLENAAHWLRKAADEGEARAQYVRGRMHQLGRGMLQDLEQAAHWYRRVAAQGHDKAKEALAELQKE